MLKKVVRQRGDVTVFKETESLIELGSTMYFGGGGGGVSLPVLSRTSQNELWP